MVTIEWAGTPKIKYKATFVSSPVAGVRVVVDTFWDGELAKVEAGPMAPMLESLTDPAGEYRLGVMMTATLVELIEDMLAGPSLAFEVKDETEDGQPLVACKPVELHPTTVAALGAIAPSNSIYSNFRSPA